MHGPQSECRSWLRGSSRSTANVDLRSLFRDVASCEIFGSRSAPGRGVSRVSERLRSGLGIVRCDSGRFGFRSSAAGPAEAGSRSQREAWRAAPPPGQRPVLRPGPDRESSRIRLALVLPGVLGDTDPPFGPVPPADLRPLSGGDVGRERADSSVLTIRGCPTSRRHPLSKHSCPDPIPEYAVLGEAEKLARHSHSRIRGHAGQPPSPPCADKRSARAEEVLRPAAAICRRSCRC